MSPFGISLTFRVLNSFKPIIEDSKCYIYKIALSCILFYNDIYIWNYNI